MTFLYTSSVIVEELKAAVLSKTKPNKLEKQAERLQRGEAQSSSPSSVLCLPLGAPEPNLGADLGGPVSAGKPKGPASSPAQKDLCPKADPSNRGIF